MSVMVSNDLEEENAIRVMLEWSRTVATVVQEVEKAVSNQKVVSSIPCRSVLEQEY